VDTLAAGTGNRLASGTVNFFDFSDEVQRAATEASDDLKRWGARTEVGRRLFPDAVERAGFSLLQPRAALSQGASEHVLVVGAASWSDPDLAAPDRLAQDTRNRVVGYFETSLVLEGLTGTGGPTKRQQTFVRQYVLGGPGFLYFR
jgi:hypothetical protein